MSDPAEEPPPPAVTFLSSVRPALVCSPWPSQGTADPPAPRCPGRARDGL